MESVRSEDLSTVARIRHAALKRFVSDGMHASMRSIAQEAGVSAGLIVHHFGSAKGLREACSRHVLEEIRSGNTGVLSPMADPESIRQQLASLTDHTLAVGYILRLIQAGGPEASTFIEHLVSDAVGYLQAAEQAGIVSPSRYPKERARLLADQSLGSLVLNFSRLPTPLDLETLEEWLGNYMSRIVGPVLEMYSTPVLARPDILNTFLAATSEGNHSSSPTTSDQPTSDETARPSTQPSTSRLDEE